jgi:L-fucose isomerase-like protein
LAAHEAVDSKAAEAEAGQYWIGPAQKVVEPSRADIINSARLYLAIKDIMIQERAQAITSSHCMGQPAKGCLTFSKLNDLGLVGACEGDMDSTLTMLIFAYAFGVPGFISDPLFDTSKNAVIHAHCTSTTKLDGPSGQRAPFLIRTQCDSNQGVSLEVQMRVGQEITCAKLINLDTMLISTGKIVELTDFHDRGCRTQITTEVANAKHMVRHWGGGVLDGDMMTLLHRVVFYGNQLERMRDLATLMGLKVVEEA